MKYLVLSFLSLFIASATASAECPKLKRGAKLRHFHNHAAAPGGWNGVLQIKRRVACGKHAFKGTRCYDAIWWIKNGEHRTTAQVTTLGKRFQLVRNMTAVADQVWRGRCGIRGRTSGDWYETRSALVGKFRIRLR